MQSGSLFGDRVIPACEYCEFAVEMGQSAFRMCHRKGVVSIKFSCRYYQYDPIARVPRRPLVIERYNVNDFIL